MYCFFVPSLSLESIMKAADEEAAASIDCAAESGIDAVDCDSDISPRSLDAAAASADNASDCGA